MCLSKSKWFVMVFVVTMFILVTPSLHAEALEFWMLQYTPETQDVLENELLPEFTKETGIDVNVTYLTWGTMFPRLVAGKATGTSPDVFQYGYSSLAELVRQELVLDISPFTLEWDGTANFYPIPLRVNQFEGKQYGLPMGTDPRVLGYRKNLFADAGLDPEVPPVDWNEARDYAAKLTIWKGEQLVQAGFYMPFEGLGLEHMFTMSLWSNGGNLFNDDATEVAFSGPEGIGALEYLTSMVHDIRSSSPDLVPEPGLPSLLVSSDVAMDANASGVVFYEFRKFAPSELDQLGFAPIPAAPGGESPSFLGSIEGFISKDSKRIEEAWRLLSFLTTPENMYKYASTTGSHIVLPRKDAEPFADYYSDSRFQVLRNALTYARAYPHALAWSQIRDRILINALQAAMYGKVTPQQALAQAAQQANELLTE